MIFLPQKHIKPPQPEPSTCCELNDGHAAAARTVIDERVVRAFTNVRHARRNGSEGAVATTGLPPTISIRIVTSK